MRFLLIVWEVGRPQSRAMWSAFSNENMFSQEDPPSFSDKRETSNAVLLVEHASANLPENPPRRLNRR